MLKYQRVLAPDFRPDVWENHNAGCVEDHKGMVGEQDQLGQGSVAKKNPDREEGNGEEVADEYERLLDESGQESDGTTDGTDLEVAETAALEGFQASVYRILDTN